MLCGICGKKSRRNICPKCYRTLLKDKEAMEDDFDFLSSKEKSALADPELGRPISQYYKNR